ncbi:transcription factor E2F3-like isoform X2 [Cebidichthys violaceus]|uniref:transcription factor E2F3-like isoform X2 n=1 Tax=Cebidichthys violaceus TaxID=271503 RepID=UPI0035CABA4B
MVKCVVSTCPNRTLTVNRLNFNRPRKKRFFNFPTDPARLKVWLAALREAELQDSNEQHFICEDHFLPEDLTANGITGGAIPIMPPDLDPGGPWGAESSEEEEQWVTGDCEEEEEEEEEEDESGDDAPPSPNQPLQNPGGLENPGGGLENPLEAERTRKQSNQSQEYSTQDGSLGLLTLRFLELLLAAPDGALDLRDVAEILQTNKRRVYDITHVLNEIDFIQKEPTNWVKWIGKIPISCFLRRNLQTFQRELENLKQVEDRLDGLIKSCSQQLFDLTDDVENAASAYVTHEDIRRLRSVQQQTIIIIKAPEETKLEVPAPQEDSIQVHLKGGRGPIVVLTCEMGSGDPGFFQPLEESRVRTTTLLTGQSA